MAAAIGWYGPLVDLSKASSYIGGYVQLLVYVHRSTPVQYKISRNGGEVVRMDILVGDETRSYFPVTIWQKQMGSQVSAGHVYLLQNLEITRFGDVVEARAIHCSSLQCLLRPDDFVATNGLDKVIEECRVGITARDKLQKVVQWLQQARLVHCRGALNYYEGNHRGQIKVNWKVHEEMRSQDISSLSELYQCENNWKANFHASVGEIFLPITWVDLDENEAERMFISRRLHTPSEKSIVDDLITTAGCQMCGTPVKPFLLYVWDDMKYLPISVGNKAAEILFGSISAEKVYSSYKNQQRRKDATNPGQSTTEKIDDKEVGDQKADFYTIWLILLNTLFRHGENSPLRFKVAVNKNRDWENGRLEMVSVSFPAFGRTI
ncbi:hypothetical protein OROGR_032627 [Orobanche gracilis]